MHSIPLPNSNGAIDGPTRNIYKVNLDFRRLALRITLLLFLVIHNDIGIGEYFFNR
jgi:hypothetical protein